MILVRVGETLQRVTAGVGVVAVIAVVNAYQRFNRIPFHGVRDDRVGGVALVGVGTAVESVQLGERQTSLEVQSQPLVQLGVQLGVDIVLRVTRALHDAFLVVVSEADVVLQLLRATVHVDVVLLLQASAAEYLILIVNTVNRLPDVEVVIVAVRPVGVKLILVVSIVVGVHGLNELRHLLPADGAVEVNLGLALVAALGGHDDDTVGTAGTVDGR